MLSSIGRLGMGVVAAVVTNACGVMAVVVGCVSIDRCCIDTNTYLQSNSKVCVAYLVVAQARMGGGGG